MDWAQVIITLLVSILVLFLLVIVMLLVMFVRLSFQIKALVRSAEVAIESVSRGLVSIGGITSLAGAAKSLLFRKRRKKGERHE
jgi:hypothetical protein